jgi:hypothetical protein
MADSVNVIDRLVKEHQPETEFLEFKGGLISKDINGAKAYFSETLSAFANTSGGILIFGVDARPDPITKLPVNKNIFVPNVVEFRKQLWERRREAITDGIIGLEIQPVVVSGDEGYVVCHVPEGKQKPYRAEFQEAKYFFRNGDSNVVMPHAVLRSMFYPQSQPILRCEWWHRRDYEQRFQYGINIKNDGSATAEDLFIKMHYGNAPLEFDLLEPLAWVKKKDQLLSLRGLHIGEQLQMIGQPLQNIPASIYLRMTITCKDTPMLRLVLPIIRDDRILLTEAKRLFAEVESDDDGWPD